MYGLYIYLGKWLGSSCLILNHFITMEVIDKMETMVYHEHIGEQTQYPRFFKNNFLRIYIYIYIYL